jgi:hypothetical protein
LFDGAAFIISDPISEPMAPAIMNSAGCPIFGIVFMPRLRFLIKRNEEKIKQLTKIIPDIESHEKMRNKVGKRRLRFRNTNSDAKRVNVMLNGHEGVTTVAFTITCKVNG